MTFLMFQIFMSLLIAATIGAGAVWLLRRNAERRREGIIQREWRERVRQVELDRDRTVRRLASELEARQNRAEGGADALADYEKLVAGLEERVAERENAISEHRTEIQLLRRNLRETEQAAAELRAQHERDLLAIQAEQERHLKAREDESSERDSRIWQLEADAVERERKLVKLRQQLTEATDEAGSDAARAELLAERESQIRQLEAEISTRDASIAEMQQQIDEVARQAERAAEHASRVDELETAIASRNETITRLQEQIDEATREAETNAGAAEQAAQHARVIDELEAKIASRDETVAQLQQQLDSAQREVAARSGGQTAQQEQRVKNLESVIAARDDTIVKLRRELKAMQREIAEQPPVPAADMQIRQLEAALKQRDDSIAVLRDDIAELTGGPRPAGRGRQDEMLRAAIAESEQFQQQYRSVSEQLARREAELEAMRRELDAAGPGAKVAATTSGGRSAGSKRRRKSQVTSPRSAGERIAVLLTKPDDGHRDDLQEIHGIGPALEKTLNEIGIYHFHQIAQFDAADVGRIAREIGRFGNRIERDDWVGQAQVLHRKYHG